MRDSVRINPNQPLPMSMDYAALYQEGIKLIQQLAGEVWTDYNDHDPGVTILEYLCFGLSDLGYRTDFPVTDFLYAADKELISPEQNTFYPPEQILPCAPLNIYDYRRIIISEIEAVRNVWVNPVDELIHKGLYDIQLQLNLEHNQEYDLSTIKGEVRDLFTKHRNLCEDIRNIDVLQEQALLLKMEIELNPDASAEQIWAQLIHKLEHLLNPGVPIQNIVERLAQGVDINKLLDGPWLHNGYIDPNDLHHLPTVLYKSQIQNAIAAIPGIRSIRRFEVWQNDLPHLSEEIKIAPNSFLVLDKAMKNWSDSRYPISFIRNNFKVLPNVILVEQNFKNFVSKEIKQVSKEMLLPKQLYSSAKSLAEIGEYYSIQRFFPAVYGIGNYGLAQNANRDQQIKVRQLKGYLAIFETLLASHLKKLTQLKQVFFVDPPLKTEQKSDTATPTPSSTALELEILADIPDIKTLIDEKKWADLQQKNHESSLQARHEILDHLLARFGETAHNDWSYPFLNNPIQRTQFQNDWLESKYRILGEYTTLSRERGLGFNYRQARLKNVQKSHGGQHYSLQQSDNVSGLKKRLCYWLNLLDYSDHELTQFFPFSQYFKPQLKLNPERDQTAIPMSELLRYGQIPEHYTIQEEELAWALYFRGMDGKRCGPLSKAQTRDEATTQRDEFIQAVNAFDRCSKSFFILEHTLLRPTHERGKKMILTVNNIPPTLETKVPLPVFHSEQLSAEELQSIEEDLLAICISSQNYEVLENLEKGQYFIQIKRNKQVVLTSQEAYPNKTEAEAVKKACIQKFKDLLHEISNQVSDPSNENEVDFANWSTWYKTETEPSLIQPPDIAFFSYRISIFLPDWPSVFMEDGFHKVFHQILIQHIPAHIQADIHWMNWDEMNEFEGKYFAWVKVKSNQDATPRQVDEAAAALVELLKKRKRQKSN